MKLPQDVKAYIAKKVAVRLTICLLLEAAAVVVVMLWGRKLLASVKTGITVLCYVVFFLLPFVFSGVPLKLIDRTWYGVVEKVDVDTTYDNDQPFKPTLEHFYLKNTVYLTVKEPDTERLIIKKVYAGRAKLQRHINTYKKGDTVFHLYGSQHTIVLPIAHETHVQCAVCGAMNELPEIGEGEEPTCHNCNLTLIRRIK
ncbi:MAG: hypothetical protein IJU52_02675 [Clostridia bacterium]|nr:hypothetical protein [Clostridia bacterium]